MMMDLERLPPELVEALSSDRGFSLLIKGAPGTGKTMLALEILKEFGDSNGVYLSTRVSPSSLYEQFPWLEDSVPPLNIIDATKLYVSAEAPFGIQSFPEILYSRLGKIKRPATIVIDSWDAVIAQVEDERRIIALEAAIAELVRQARINLVLVSENLETGTLDYMVDGIVVLRSFDIDYRRMRELEIKKLRGVRIKQHKYPFTLHGGRFRSCHEFRFHKIKNPRTKVLPNVEGHVSTGIKELDEILGGGYRRGGFIVFDVGSDISAWGGLTIFGFSMVNAIKSGYYVVCLPFSGRGERYVRSHIMPFVGEEAYNRYVTVFEICELEEAEGGSKTLSEDVKREVELGIRGGNVVPLMGESIEDDLSMARKYIAGLDPPVLTIIGTDVIEHLYRLEERGKLSDAIKELTAYALQTRARGDVTLVRITPELKMAPQITEMASAYFKITTIDRAIILYGIRPETGHYCLSTVVVEEDCIIPELTPYV